jgi:hypothetical protein
LEGSLRNLERLQRLMGEAQQSGGVTPPKATPQAAVERRRPLR